MGREMKALRFLRILLGLAALAFIPGLAWSLVLFKRRKMGVLERITLSICLSVALVSIAVMFLNITLGVRINVANSLLIIAALTLLPLAYHLRRTGFLRALYARVKELLERGAPEQ